MKYTCDVAIVGSGMGSLAAASLLASRGLKVIVAEQNYLPGGCTSSYWRKGFTFEAGATTLVGLDDHMPLKYLLDSIGVSIPARKLELPMQVRLNDGTLINRYQPIDQWIAEAERVFGPANQKAFWQLCYEISQFVWHTSIKQLHFPPTSLSDLLRSAMNVTPAQLRNARYAFVSMKELLQKFGLHDHPQFVAFVNEQLMITAQNTIEEVNVLFGATALCYTNYGNYYIDGGLINLINPLVDYIKSNNGEVLLRNGVHMIERTDNFYTLKLKNGTVKATYLVSGIPLNNTLAIFPQANTRQNKHRLMGSELLNSAFQMGIGFRPHQPISCLHHQIHLPSPLASVGSASIFISFSHPEDLTRADDTGHLVASISTHLPDPEHQFVDNEQAEQAVIDTLEANGIILRENIVYKHSSSARSWEKWTGRAFGFVGGYPQFMRIKPWQMKDARLDGHKAYIVGDSTYPGQGIPGTTLSGIIAYQKMVSDWKL